MSPTAVQPRRAVVISRPPGHHNGCNELLEACPLVLNISRKRCLMTMSLTCSRLRNTAISFAQKAIQKNAWRFAAHGGCILNEPLALVRFRQICTEAALSHARACVCVYAYIAYASRSMVLLAYAYIYVYRVYIYTHVNDT